MEEGDATPRSDQIHRETVLRASRRKTYFRDSHDRWSRDGRKQCAGVPVKKQAKLVVRRSWDPRGVSVKNLDDVTNEGIMKVLKEAMQEEFITVKVVVWAR